MHWAIRFGALLAALAGGTVGLGALLPREHLVARRARFNQSPEALWERITDHEREPEWRRGVRRVQRLPDRDAHAMWRETGRNIITLETTVLDRPRRLVRRIAGENLPYGGKWEYTLTPASEGGTILEVTERGEIYNPLFRLASRVIGQSRTIEGYLRALGKSFGENVEIEE